VRACDSKRALFFGYLSFVAYDEKVTRRFSGGSFGFDLDLDLDLLNERNAARPPQRCRDSRRSYRAYPKTMRDQGMAIAACAAPPLAKARRFYE
jgi:hypothetical protein